MQLETEFIVAVRHCTMSAHTVLTKILKMGLQYNKSVCLYKAHIGFLFYDYTFQSSADAGSTVSPHM